MNQQPFITLVDQILAAKKQHTHQSFDRGNTPRPSDTPLDRGEYFVASPLERGQEGCSDTSALEREIDQMVYKLYGLTDEEIAIVEGGDKNGNQILGKGL